MTGTNPPTGTPELPDSENKNELGKALDQAATAARPYYTQITLAVLVAIVAFVGWSLYSRSVKARQTIGWDEFYKCRAADDFSDLADKYPEYSVGHWARLTAGQNYLNEGLGQILLNREVSDTSLNRAKSSYETLLKSNAKTEIRERALYGLGIALEALSDGNEQAAIDAYEQLLKENKDSAHRLAAEARIEALKNPQAGEFYSWFRKQNPKPEDRPTPLDRPILNPDDVFKDFELPAETTAPFSSGLGADEMSAPAAEPVPASEAPESETPAPAAEEAPALEVPAEAPAMEAPAAEAPATETPSSETPVTEETPAAETPATEAAAMEAPQQPEPAPAVEPAPAEEAAPAAEPTEEPAPAAEPAEEAAPVAEPAPASAEEAAQQ